MHSCLGQCFSDVVKMKVNGFTDDLHKTKSFSTGDAAQNFQNKSLGIWKFENNALLL